MSDNTPKVVATGKRDKAINEVERHETSQDTSELKSLKEEPDMTSERGEDVSNAPDSKNRVFAMSSFWNEMERLTIKDILGSRITSRTPPPRSLSPLVESIESDSTDTADSGYFTPHVDDTKTVSTIADLEQANVNFAASIHDISFNSLDVMWDGEPRPVSLGSGLYPQNVRLTSDTDNPQPLLSTISEERRQRQMLKNTSVHNLHTLDSEQFSGTWKVQTSAAVIPEESESERECFSDVQKPCCDCGTDPMSSSLFTEGTPAKSYQFSLTNIFQYLFAGKQSNPKPPESEDTETHSCGNTVPETYDQFFSEFDCGSFFYPHIETEDRPKDKPVPIFSRSRSSSRFRQFPEAYDHFLSSSSSSDSSAESEEEDDLGPIRVVTRYNRRTIEESTSTDIYENSFTDWDLHRNLFWNNTFSLRNVHLTGPVSQEQQSSGPLTPVDRSSMQRRRRVFPSINALGNQDTVVLDPLVYHFQERVYRQLSRHTFSFDDLQSAVSNPSLGPTLVPLRQSDMCLVCIAFASWVLKSANPQVEDAWKAVLLANVSALSAIRYLRRYMRERSLEQPAISRPTLSPIGGVNL
ncbi:PGC-1 and ERR-induced regulator in muscle protein 1 [Merluccius polli]|uniref:PGC-1 and ERR-induced regulator in muscle protein 1 n=1 Tax=Merluccius polli TaxID=89951 RepID=A0AA47P7E8_MERPO|nr:PGC-1 and ERR-induced regulator in muscle protein 1 [Merluccius polli]